MLEKYLTKLPFYDKTWFQYEKIMQHNSNQDKLKQERRILIIKGREEAHAKIEELQHIGKKKLPFVKGRKCVGKCKQCNEWMFHDQSLLDVLSLTMPEGTWNFLFADDPPKYRKNYFLGRIKVHLECAMPCPSCSRSTFLHKLARYGMCYHCLDTKYKIKKL